eukprot:281103-Pyramimonas_sp.AAC.2
MDPDLLLTMYKSFLQVNYSCPGKGANALLPALKKMFKILRTHMSSQCWAELLPYALAQVASSVMCVWMIGARVRMIGARVWMIGARVRMIGARV